MVMPTMPPMQISAGGGGPSESTGGSVSNPFSWAWSADNSGWVINNKGSGTMNAEGGGGSTTGGGNGQSTGGLSGLLGGDNAPYLLLGLIVLLLVRR